MILSILTISNVSCLELLCVDPEVLLEGSNSDDTILVDEGREDPNTTKSGQSSANQRNTI